MCNKNIFGAFTPNIDIREGSFAILPSSRPRLVFSSVTLHKVLSPSLSLSSGLCANLSRPDRKVSSFSYRSLHFTCSSLSIALYVERLPPRFPVSLLPPIAFARSESKFQFCIVASFSTVP